MDISENQVLNNLVIDSRDLFAKEKYEERIDYKLAVLIERFQKQKMLSSQQRDEVKRYVEEFIRDVQSILLELEKLKRKAVEEEYNKINQISSLLFASAKVPVKTIRKRLEIFGKELEANSIASLRVYMRQEKRLSKGKAPHGFFLKKLKDEKALSIKTSERTEEMARLSSKEHPLLSEVNYLIKAFNKKPDKETLEQLLQRTEMLINNYKKDIDDFINIEINIDIEEARKLHRIDHYITFIKIIRGFEDLIEKLNNLRESAEKWVFQDSITAKKLLEYSKRLKYGLHVLETSRATDIPGIITLNSPINNIVPGILIYQRGKPLPNRGIVLIHGITGNKELFLYWGKDWLSKILWFILLTLHHMVTVEIDLD